jgi:hypothetical protein
MPANNTGSSPDALGAVGFADTRTRKLDQAGDQAGDPAAGCPPGKTSTPTAANSVTKLRVPHLAARRDRH